MPARTPSLTRTLHKRLTTLIAAASVTLAAFASSTSPARASDDALLKFLLGATAIAIIVHGASNARAEPQRSGQARPRGLPQHCRETLSINRRHVMVYNAQCLRNAGLRNLPQQCRETIRTNHGPRSVFRAGCLERNYAAPRHSGPRYGDGKRGRGSHFLPGHCRVSYRYGGRQHVGFDARCLQNLQIRDLPGTCRVRGQGGQIYSGHCLREHGYSFR